MLEHYQAQAAFGVEFELEVVVHRQETASYYLSVAYRVGDVAFDASFGVPGGYVGRRNLGELICRTGIQASPADLNMYFERQTPHLEADFLVGSNEIRIRRIERNAILPGQRFCERTVRQLLEITPGTISVFFDWILNHHT